MAHDVELVVGFDYDSAQAQALKQIIDEVNAFVGEPKVAKIKFEIEKSGLKDLERIRETLKTIGTAGIGIDTQGGFRNVVQETKDLTRNVNEASSTMERFARITSGIKTTDIKDIKNAFYYEGIKDNSFIDKAANDIKDLSGEIQSVNVKWKEFADGGVHTASVVVNAVDDFGNSISRTLSYFRDVDEEGEKFWNTQESGSIKLKSEATLAEEALKKEAQTAREVKQTITEMAQAERDYNKALSEASAFRSKHGIEFGDQSEADNQINSLLNSLKEGETTLLQFRNGLNDVGASLAAENTPMQNMIDSMFAFKDASEEGARATERRRAEIEAAFATEQEATKSLDDYYRALQAIESLRSKIAGASQWTAALGGGEDVRNAYHNIQNLTTEINKLEDSLKKGEATSSSVQTSIRGLNAEFQKQANVIKEAGANQKSFIDRMGSITQVVARYFTVYRVFWKAVNTIKDMVKEVVRLDDAMTQLRVVTDNTEAEYSRFSKTVASTAREIGASVKDLIDSTTTYARLGYSLEEASELSRFTAMLQNVGKRRCLAA